MQPAMLVVFAATWQSWIERLVKCGSLCSHSSAFCTYSPIWLLRFSASACQETTSSMTDWTRYYSGGKATSTTLFWPSKNTQGLYVTWTASADAHVCLTHQLLQLFCRHHAAEKPQERGSMVQGDLWDQATSAGQTHLWVWGAACRRLCCHLCLNLCVCVCLRVFKWCMSGIRACCMRVYSPVKHACLGAYHLSILKFCAEIVFIVLQ